MVARRIRSRFGTIAVGVRAIPPGAGIPVRHSWPAGNGRMIGPRALRREGGPAPGPHGPDRQPSRRRQRGRPGGAAIANGRPAFRAIDQEEFRSMTTEQAAATINPWAVAQQQFDLAAEHLKLDPGIRAVLREPRRALTVDVPGPDGRRDDPRLHRLPRPAQPGPRPGQGRHPLPPGRHARRGQGPRDVDDLEVRGRRHPVRRRQGRRHRRPQEALHEGARGADPPVHHRDQRAHRARARHPGAGRQHDAPDHGLDDGHLLHARRVHGPGRRDRQADQPRRVRGSQRGHGARLRLYDRGRGEAPRHRPHQDHHRGPGLRQRRVDRRAPHARRGLHGRRRLRHPGRDPQPGRPRHREGRRLEAGARHGRRVPRQHQDHERRAPRAPRATS